jgi:hypothetical protein
MGDDSSQDRFRDQTPAQANFRQPREQLRRRALEGYIAIGSLLRLRSGSSLIRATAKVQSLCLIFDSKTNNHHQKCCIDPYTTVVIDKIKPNEGAMISHLFIRFNRRAE